MQFIIVFLHKITLPLLNYNLTDSDIGVHRNRYAQILVTKREQQDFEMPVEQFTLYTMS